MTTQPRNPTPRAFTLVEIVVVILILGILAGVAAPKLIDASKQAAEAAFVTEMFVYVSAIERYKATTGEYPPDGYTATMPTELEPYADGSKWGEPTPVGGSWDNETRENGVTQAFGVYRAGSSPAVLEAFKRIDSRIDDGDLATGSLRYIARDRFYYVIEE